MIILASHSPRRQALLKRIIPAFESHPAAVNERALPILPPPEYVQSLAKAKGESLVPSYPGQQLLRPIRWWLFKENYWVSRIVVQKPSK